MSLGAFFSRHRGNAVAGGMAGAAFHAVHYGVAAGTGLAIGMTPVFNVAASAACLGASYFGWLRFMGGHKYSTQEKRGSFLVQAALAAGVAFGVHALAAHDHMSNEKMVWFTSLPEVMRTDMLEQTRKTYLGLPAELRTRLDAAAAEQGILPEIFIITCSGEDQISRDIIAFITAQNTENKQKNMISGFTMSREIIP